ncbi:MAG: hypothetical protein AM1032_000180 [Mycoplasmataceae bacterium]|nr:MAG: hypothetical protein AM1032_000180 [Mycoplasmataceae bacterium]
MKILSSDKKIEKNKNKNIEKIEFTKEGIKIHLANGEIIEDSISRLKNLNKSSKEWLNSYEINSKNEESIVINRQEIEDEIKNIENSYFPNE